MLKRLMLLSSLCLLMSLPVQAQQEASPAPFTFKPGQSVYVIAVKHRPVMSRDYWAELHRDLPQRNRVVGGSGAAPPTDPKGRATLDRAPAERATLDSAEPILPLNEPADEALKIKVSEMLRRQKKFNVVDSLAQADFVLFVQGEYVPFYQRHEGNSGLLIMKMEMDDTDTAANQKLIKIQAAAIPASLFQSAKKVLPDNAETVRWRGREAGRMQPGAHFNEPSLENLLKRLQKDVLK